MLYNMLAEREPHETISHSRMPTLEEHKAFVMRVPYKGWYFIHNNDAIVGSIYITYANEIGIHITKPNRRCGYAELAIAVLIKLHKEKFYLANINPNNEKSVRLFTKIGFGHIQNTYKFGGEISGKDYDKVTGKSK